MCLGSCCFGCCRVQSGLGGVISVVVFWLLGWVFLGIKELGVLYGIWVVLLVGM